MSANAGKNLGTQVEGHFLWPPGHFIQFFYHTHQRLGVANMHVSLSKLSVFAVSV